MTDAPAAGAAHEAAACLRASSCRRRCARPRAPAPHGRRARRAPGLRPSRAGARSCGPRAGDHHVVDRRGQLPEERLQRSRVVGVEGRGASRADFARCLLEAVGIAAGEDDVGTLGTGASGCLEPDARAAADHDDGLSDQFRLARAACPSPRHVRHLRVHRADRRRHVRDLHAERLHGCVVDPREAREGLDRVAEHLERDVGADGERRLLQPLTGFGPERVGAGQSLAVAEQRHEPVGLGVGVRVGGGLRHV